MNVCNECGDNCYILEKYNDYFLGLLYSLDREGIPLTSGNNEYRTLLSIILHSGIYDVDMNCNEIKNLAEKGKSLRAETASQSRQWINIPLDFEKLFRIKPNDSNIAKGLLSVKNRLGLSGAQCSHLKNLLLKLTMHIIDTNKVKSNSFFKINATPRSDDLSVYVSGYDLTQRRETQFYKELTEHVYLQHLPNIATLIYGGYCNIGVGEIIVSEDGKRVPLGKYFQSGTKGYNILITEMMEGSKPLSKYIDEYLSSDKDDNFKEFFSSVMLQMTYALEVFRQIRFVQNDLHWDNIMIEELEEPIEFYYIVMADCDNIKKVIYHKTKYLVRIFDFDLSYKLDEDIPDIIQGSGAYGVAQQKIKTRGKRIGIKFEEIVSYGEDYRDKIDFYYWLRYIEFRLREVRKDTLSPNGKENYDFIHRYINKIINRVDSTENNYTSIFRGTAPNSIDEKDEHWEAIGKCYNSQEWLNYMMDNPGDEIVKSSNTIIYDSIQEIPITKDMEIYFNPIGNVRKISEMLYENSSWNKLSMYQKMIVCGTLVSNKEYQSIMDAKLTTVDLSKSVNVSAFATSVDMSGGYYHKYMKYKTKYLNLRKRI